MTTDRIYTHDPGNLWIKGATDTKQVTLLHASARLSDSDLKTLRETGDDSDVYIINGEAYIIGGRARRYRGEFVEGASRYEQDYYQRYLGACLYEVYPDSRNDIILYAGCAPRDRDYKADIKAAAIGKMSVEYRGKTKRFQVRECYTWDEPVGGCMNVLLSAKGEKFNQEYRFGDMLVIDIGGLTIDYIILQNAAPDFLSARSYVDRNILDAIDSFKLQLRTRYAKEFKSLRNWDDSKVYDAIHSGVYSAGAYGRLDCQHEADNVCEGIVDSVFAYYRQYGGEQLDFVLLTGGGSGLLEQRIRNRMMIDGVQRRGVKLAHKRETIYMANALGAHKMAHFYVNHGKIQV